MNKLDQSSNTRSFSRHKFQKFYFKKSLKCKIFKINTQNLRNSNLNPQIYRPFIQFSRFEFLKFCEFWYLPVIPDLTNLNMHFSRNRLRLQSLPYLKFFFNIHLFQKINSIQKIINLENEYFQLIIQKLLLTSLKAFQYSKRKKSFRPRGRKTVIIFKCRKVNLVKKISKTKHSSFIAEINLNCYPFIAQNFPPIPNSRRSRVAPPQHCKSVMFKIYTKTSWQGQFIVENIEKNIQIYCPYLGLISLYPLGYQRFYYKLIKSCFQATHSDLKYRWLQLTHWPHYPWRCQSQPLAGGGRSSMTRTGPYIIHLKTWKIPCFAYRNQPIFKFLKKQSVPPKLPLAAFPAEAPSGSSPGLVQSSNIELFLWIHKYFWIQCKQKQSLFRANGLKIKLDLDKKKFNKKLLQKITGSKIHFIQYNLLGLKSIRFHDLSTSHLLYPAGYNFLYFPKILQYRILHNFYHFIQKKISFNEISCIFQRITVFLNPQYSKKK